MKKQHPILLAGVGLAGAALALRARANAARWEAKTRELVEELEHPASSSSSEAIDTLPAPVKRYLRFALGEESRSLRRVRLHQEGVLRTSQAQPAWRPFRADQCLAAIRPGFVWDARVCLPLGTSVRVRDAFVSGRGSSEVQACSLLELANVEDKPELNEGALLRYLAEAVWCPTALRPSAHLRWSARDDLTALATLRDGATTASLEFRFLASGEVASVFSPARPREVGGHFEPTPWEGRHFNYQKKNGLMIPTEGEVEWHLPEGKFSVWKGKIDRIEHDFSL